MSGHFTFDDTYYINPPFKIIIIVYYDVPETLQM